MADSEELSQELRARYENLLDILRSYAIQFGMEPDKLE